LDNTPPVFEEMIDDIIPRNTKKWEWCARDEDSQIRYRFVMDQKPFSIPTGPFTNVRQTILTEKNGKWYVHIQAKDRAGNISPVKTVFAQMTTQKEGLNYNINVNFFSSAIKPIHNKGILSLGKILQTYPNTVAIIEAHTDNIGEQNKNLRLSQKRADYVRKILIERSHISPDRIKSFGYGSTRPIADNNTPEGQLKNRRAEALIFYTKMNE
jgi:outer membrane protein OmpA-like peptidoglycan-associated protein